MTDQERISVIARFLQDRKYKKTLETLLKEAHISNPADLNLNLDGTQNLADAHFRIESVSQVSIIEVFKQFRENIIFCPEKIKTECNLILYPIFVHIYLHLISDSHFNTAKNFFSAFKNTFDTFYSCDLLQLSHITSCEQLLKSNYATILTQHKFTVHISSESMTFIQKIIESNIKFEIFTRIMSQNIKIIVHSKIRDANKILQDQGSMLGESPLESNRVKILYGVRGFGFKNDATVNNESQAYNKRANDLVCPDVKRVPYPDLTDFETNSIQSLVYERSQMEKLGNKLPSAAIYTILNSKNKINNAVFSDDSSILALGSADSSVKVWSLTFQKLKILKNYDEIGRIDVTSGDFYERCLTEKNSENTFKFLGHSGPIYGLSISPFNNYLLSSGFDGEIRLWQLWSKSCVSVYKSHFSTVWDVQFCPRGYYFVSSGMDQTSLLWNVECETPLRAFVGHYSDVYCSVFHPNSNYIATGSTDRSVRIWDLSTGNSVRLFTGFKAEIRSLKFSPDGLFLFVGDQEGSVYLYDISDGQRLCCFQSHNMAVTSIAISQDFEIMASGGLDSSVKLWRMKDSALKYLDSHSKEFIQYNQAPAATYNTKRTPIYSMNFNFRNVLTCVGEYRQK